VLVLLGKLSGGVDDILDQRCQLHSLWVELELSSLDLREVEHLVDEAKEVSPSAVHALQWFLRLFSAEAGRVFHHPLVHSHPALPYPSPPLPLPLSHPPP